MNVRLLILVAAVGLTACETPTMTPDAGKGGGTSGTGGGTTGTGGGTSGTGGGSTAGGSTAGGSTAGGSTAGGSTAGGSTAGGSTAGGSTAGGSTAGTVFVATLSGTREVPANNSTATGSAMVTLNAAETSITYSITHTVANPTLSHIHTGLAYTNGGVAIAFASATSPITGTSNVTAQQVSDLKAGKLYVNVHSGAFGGGEVRGQLLRVGEQLFRTTMSGANEVPPNTTTGSGGLQVIINSGGTAMNCLGTFTGLTGAATGAHIHNAAVGSNGGIAFGLTVPAGTSELTCTNTSITANDIANATAGTWYVNVHTATNAGGEIRGQLGQP